VFDQGIGDLFSVRVAGNTASNVVVTGSLEYAAVNLGCPLLVVLGHSGCGAVQAAIDVVANGVTAPGAIGAAVAHVEPAVRAVEGVPAGQLLASAVSENVRRQTALLERSRALAHRVETGKLGIVGAVCDVGTGRVTLLD
jgi:carbonic anhydrase